MMTEYREIATVEDVEAIRQEIADFAAEGWAQDDRGRIDWEEWGDRFEARGYALPEQWDDPAWRRIKAIAREAVSES